MFWVPTHPSGSFSLSRSPPPPSPQPAALYVVPVFAGHILRCCNGFWTVLGTPNSHHIVVQASAASELAWQWDPSLELGSVILFSWGGGSTCLARGHCHFLAKIFVTYGALGLLTGRPALLVCSHFSRRNEGSGRRSQFTPGGFSCLCFFGLPHQFPAAALTSLKGLRVVTSLVP